MASITDSSLSIQTSCESVPSTPCWLGEVVLMVSHLRKFGVLDAISSQVRFARRRFGHYEVIDFLVFSPNLRTNLSVRNKTIRWFRSKNFPESSNSNASHTPDNILFITTLEVWI